VTRPPPPLLPVLRDALAREGRLRLPLRGDSMLPTLPRECEIEVAALAGQPRVGELLVFALGDGLVAHRLARRAGERLICQGDGRRAPDPPLRREQVLGRVVRATVDGAPVWPRRGERARAAWWVARAAAWQAARRVAQR
jgi:hypothetical protein